MIKKILQILKIAFGKGLPELPPRETWPVRFLLASEERWALDAILSQIKENPKKVLREICPTGLSGMLLYRLWQHGFYTNDSWDKNPKCKKVSENFVNFEADQTTGNTEGTGKSVGTTNGTEYTKISGCKSYQQVDNELSSRLSSALPNKSDQRLTINEQPEQSDSTTEDTNDTNQKAGCKSSDHLNCKVVQNELSSRLSSVGLLQASRSCGTKEKTTNCELRTTNSSLTTGDTKVTGEKAKTNCKLHPDESTFRSSQAAPSATPTPNDLTNEPLNQLQRERSESDNEHLTPSTYHVVLDRIVPILEKQRLRDISLVAQRKLAMQELDQWVVDWNQTKFGDDKSKWVTPIVIKGGATSKLYYPDETLRISGDIDVIVPKEFLKVITGNDNLNISKVTKKHHHLETYEAKVFPTDEYGVEWHWTIRRDNDWAFYENLHTTLLPGSQCLSSANDVENCKCALIHFVDGQFPRFDFIDLSFMKLKNVFHKSIYEICDDIEPKAFSFITNSLMNFFGLTTDDKCVYDSLSSKDKKVVSKYYKICSSLRVNLLQNIFEDMKKRHSFYWLLRKALFQFSPQNNKNSKYSKYDLRFWLECLIILPARKVVKLLKKHDIK